jgi:hypothetical protein
MTWSDWLSLAILNALGSNYPYSAPSSSTRDAEDRPRAQWVSPRTFAYERTVPDSFTIKRTFALDGPGRQLTVGLDVSGQVGSRSISRVYRRI